MKKYLRIRAIDIYGNAKCGYIVEQVDKQARKRAKHRMRYLVVVEPVETTIGLFGIAPFPPF